MSDNRVKIAVHNGNFHADDCMAYAILSVVFPDNQLIRTRDPDTLAQCNFRIDVGGCYNGETDFDHHQREFNEKRTDHDQIKYASAGLIWKHFGIDYIKIRQKDLSAEELTFIAKELDYLLIRYVDANDNGITIVDEEVPSLSKIIFLFNHCFGFLDNNGFLKGVDVCRDTLDGYVALLSKYIESEKVVMQAIKGHENDPILVLPQKVAFQEVINRNWDCFLNTQLIVYPESNNEKWRIKSLNSDPKDRFKNRCNAPEAWRGLTNDALEQVVGLSGLDFVHPNGFTGGAKSKDVTIAMAQKWYEIVSKSKQ